MQTLCRLTFIHFGCHLPFSSFGYETHEDAPVAADGGAADAADASATGRRKLDLQYEGEGRPATKPPRGVTTVQDEKHWHVLQAAASQGGEFSSPAGDDVVRDGRIASRVPGARWLCSFFPVSFSHPHALSILRLCRNVHLTPLFDSQLSSMDAERLSNCHRLYSDVVWSVQADQTNVQGTQREWHGTFPRGKKDSAAKRMRLLPFTRRVLPFLACMLGLLYTFRRWMWMSVRR